MLLPGRKASVFRKNLADLFIRVLGGDARLADEIKEIGEFQDTLPADHPLRAFRDAVKQDNQVERAALAPDMQAVIKSVKEQFHQQFEMQKVEFMALITREQEARAQLQAEQEANRRRLEEEREARTRLETEYRAAIQTQQLQMESQAAGMVTLDLNATGSRSTAASLSTFRHHLRQGIIRVPRMCGEPPDAVFEAGKSYQVTMSILFSLYFNSVESPVGFLTFKRHIRGYLDIVFMTACRSDSAQIELHL